MHIYTRFYGTKIASYLSKNKKQNLNLITTSISLNTKQNLKITPNTVVG